MMHIETTRTVLRPFDLSDLDDLQTILGDGQAMEYLEPPYTLEQTEQFLRQFCIERRGALAVEHKTGRQVIGYLLFSDSAEPGVYEMGWIFNRAYWRQGYAYESCAALIDYAFACLNARKIWAETVDGVRSVGLMKKLGMRPEGSPAQSGMYVYSIQK